MRFGPIRARLVRPEVAERVIIPAYDTMTPQERKELLAAEPLSFLHALRSPDEYPPDVPFPRVLEDSRAGLARLLAADAFGPVDSAAVFVYRLADGEHVQTGVVGGIDVADAAEGRILPHETTVVEREERLAAYLDHVGAASSPVVVAARFPAELGRLVAEATDATPAVSARAADGVRQTVWAPPAELRERIVAALGEVERAYLVDGHHRIAAATRVAAADPSRRRFLAAVFPLDELRNLAHHRALRSLGSSRPDELVAELER
ncbi:MAG TPA: DUF1015 family protein, partial [Actinobacteria bacterium]|nr:DUF1015 family protein [Actinomycetota bacterium]